MKVLSLIVFMTLTSMAFGQTTNAPIPLYEYQIVTSVESIVPGGLGRSRLVANAGERDHKEFTSQRTEEDRGRNKSKRSEIRVKDFEETKMLNFFNLGGIRFENIASNDAIVSSKINDLSANGWELAFVTSGVESNGGADDGQGLFITRYIFKRLKR